MTLLDRHVGFLDALRGAGVQVSLAEGLDAVEALRRTGLGDRETVRQVYAATLIKRQQQRPTFEEVFEVWFPRLIGGGVDATETRDGPQELADFTERLEQALAGDQHGEHDEHQLRQLATEAVGRFGAMPGRGPGMSSWSAYTTLQRLGLRDREGRAAGRFRELVEADARRRIAEEKGPGHVTDVTIRPALDRLDFTSMRRADLHQLRREIYPLARRLATRLTKEQHARGRGPLDMRRTIRASLGAGGVPLDTRHRPKRPHRTELVVLCDVSGSVASFAQFTLMLVFALREQFQQLRAFTFVDTVHEVTGHFRPGADPVDVLEQVAAAGAHAALLGRTNYGRAFTTFAEEYADVLGPKSSLLILGDARSNHADLKVDTLRELAGAARHAHWLNPEHRRHWGTGDSAAAEYAEIVPMAECRNLAQLAEFVHDLV